MLFVLLACVDLFSFQIQSKHFMSTSVSIEGYTVHYKLNDLYDDLVLDFHSFLSDGKEQHASTVYNHMNQLIQKLQESGVLAKTGGRIMSSTDGCASQYRSATSIFWMAVLAYDYGLVIDRAISAASHGKSIVDAINGVDKNTIMRWLMRCVQEADEAMDKKAKSMQVHSFNNSSDTPTKKYSAAADCKRVLEREGGQGVKSAGLKYEKREANRGINQRYWHVREIDEKLYQPRCVTIKIPEDGVSFTDMYHYYCCSEFGNKKWRAALRRVPCNCPACDETIRLPWIDGMPANDQPRFKNPDDCYLKPVLGDSNKWYIVDLELSDKGVPEDAELAYRQVLQHVTSSIAESVEVGQIGAVACDDTHGSSNGYYLIRFTSLPFQGQTETGEEAMMVKGQYYYEFPGAKGWFYQDDTTVEVTHSLEHVVATGVDMEGLSPGNQPPRGASRQANEKKAKKISDKSHHQIMDEINRRERLEYDPSRVLVGHEKEDNFDSDDEE